MAETMLLIRGFAERPTPEMRLWGYSMTAI